MDLVLPDGDGIEVTRRLREWSEMPILVLSAVGEEEQKVTRWRRAPTTTSPSRSDARAGGAAAGGAAAQQGAREGGAAHRVEGLEIDLAARAVRRDGEPVHLTPIEFELLRVLVRNRGRLMTHRRC